MVHFNVRVTSTFVIADFYYNKEEELHEIVQISCLLIFVILKVDLYVLHANNAFGYVFLHCIIKLHTCEYNLL